MKKLLMVIVVMLLVCGGVLSHPVESAMAGENRAKDFNLSVAITVPALGKVFSLGDIVVVKVVPQGEVENIPYELTVRFNGNISQSFEILSPDYLDAPLEFAFKLTTFGSGSFTAYLKGRDGSFALAECPYYVTDQPPVQLSALSVPSFVDKPVIGAISR